MIIATRTICDVQGNHHCLEVGNDSLLLDGRPCTFLAISHERITASADGSQPLAFATGTFWRDLAGADPSSEDAGELLALRLAAWSSQQGLLQALQPYQSLHVGSALLPEYRLDPLSEQILRVFDGTEATTLTLARILKQPPEVIGDWAARLGLAQLSITGAREVSEQEGETEPEEALTTGSLDTLPPTELRPHAPKTVARRNPRAAQFRWTPERLHTLEEAVDRVGGLGRMTQTTIKRIAAERDWPWRSVEYKLSQQWRKGTRSRETPTEPPPQEEDRPETAAHEEQFVTAS